ncbi:CoA transferase, partial [Chloroflexota bacterium]
DEIYQRGQEGGAPAGAIYTAKNILNSKQLAARDFIVEVQHQESGNLKYPGVPYQFSEIPRETPAPAPLLGQHNEEIYCERLGYTKHDLVKFKEAGVI